MLNDQSKPEDMIKKRHFYKEQEKSFASNDSIKSGNETKKRHIPEKMYNPTFDDLNEVASKNLDTIQKGIERMKDGNVSASLLCDLQFEFKNASLLSIYNVDANFILWLNDFTWPFLNFLKEVAKLIKDENTVSFVKYDVIDLASSLIHNQKTLDHRIKNP